MIYYFSTLILFNLFCVIYFDKISLLIKIIDKPNQSHKTHKKNISSVGGVLLFFNILIFSIFFFANKDLIFLYTSIFNNINELVYFLIVYSLFFFKGVFDDVKNINANLKFILSIVFILILVSLDNQILLKTLIFKDLNLEINLSFMKLIFTIFCFLTFINALNMFDGINLQVSLYSTFITLFLLINLGINLLLLTILIFLIFFSFLNYKSKCFLGDSGSLGLGFIFSYFFIKSYNIDQIILCDEIFLLMLLPGLELIRLTVSRLLKARHPFLADQNHLHHLLNQRICIKKTLLISLSVIIIPIIINELIGETIKIILVTISIYIFLIFRLKKH